MMGKRENSTLALNRLINMNHTPEQMAAISAIPPKAAKLMGDEIFSPISTGKSYLVWIRWNPFIADTIGAKISVCLIEMSALYRLFLKIEVKITLLVLS